MKTKYLSILLVVGTLLIGVILGAVGNGAMNNKRMKELSKIRRPGGFTEWVMRNANPTDDGQRVEIQEILQSFGTRFRELGNTHQEEMRLLGDSLMQDLGTVLTEEQLQSVEEAFSSRRRRFEDGQNDRRRRRPDRRGEPDGSH